MRFITRISIYLLILLLFISIYKDLTTDIRKTAKTSVASEFSQSEMTAVKREVQPGDTVLSVVEDLNKSNQTFQMNITKVINDFGKMNADIDPDQLQPHRNYYFPLYHDNT